MRQRPTGIMIPIQTRRRNSVAPGAQGLASKWPRRFLPTREREMSAVLGFSIWQGRDIFALSSSFQSFVVGLGTHESGEHR